MRLALAITLSLLVLGIPTALSEWYSPERQYRRCLRDAAANLQWPSGEASGLALLRQDVLSEPRPEPLPRGGRLADPSAPAATNPALSREGLSAIRAATSPPLPCSNRGRGARVCLEREAREARRRLDESDEPRVAELEQRRDDPASEPAAVSFSGSQLGDSRIVQPHRVHEVENLCGEWRADDFASGESARHEIRRGRGAAAGITDHELGFRIDDPELE